MRYFISLIEKLLSKGRRSELSEAMQAKGPITYPATAEHDRHG